MNIDQNEQPEEEQPVAEHTVQDVRDRTSQSVDVSMIPPGMSMEDYIAQYQHFGNVMTNVSGVPSTRQGTAVASPTTGSTDSPTAIDRETFQAAMQRHRELTEVETLLGEDHDDEEKSKPDAEDVPELTAEQIAEIKQDFRIRQIAATKRKESVKIQDMSLGSNDLIISFSGLQNGILHTDLEEEMNMEDVVKKKRTSLRRRRGKNIVRGSSSLFIFDKNGNRLTVNADVHDEDEDGNMRYRKTRRDIPRIHLSQALGQPSPLSLEIPKFVIIDKSAFLESQGVVWKVRYRSPKIPMKILLERKRKMRHSFTEMEHGVQRLRDVMLRQFREEDYEIIYNIDFVNNFNRFQLIGRFTDVTIRNSIELERYIGEMIISKDGNHFAGFLHEPELKVKLGGYVYGTRTTFTPSDAVLKYQHSHLSSGMSSNQSFCTGSENYRGADTYDSEMDIEMTFIRLGEFIKWESLEGGPHMRMEEQTIHGSKLTVSPHELNLDNVHQSYKEKMIKKIRSTEHGFALFKDCFILQADKRGNLAYIVDLPKFYEVFIAMLTKPELQSISRMGMEPIMTYKPGGHFYKIRDKDLTNPILVRQKAYNSMQSMVPLYFNGRYIRPQLIPERATESVTFSPNPFFMRDLAKYIQYNLTQQLDGKNRDKS